ncbi:MAG: DUF3109 family protein, partial [Schleiferiaceae bacterium]|nr:DUF3109 family protein [Schleiferiaceae bacterium]
MIDIDNKLVSEDLLEKDFLCNLKKCKGACCVEGDVGAPLDESENQILDDIYPEVKPYMRKEGIEAVEKQGTHVFEHGEWVTPLVNNKECAFVVFDGHVAKCAIEQAYEDGKVDWKKPISCHLYPVRITKYSSFEAVNYEKWEICSDACDLGKEVGLPIYKFLKEPLTRNYGEDWYKQLEDIAAQWK